MRIIGGSFRGRHIEAPLGQGTRPMLDRVREALFSTLLPWLEGARVLDLFAGSGSLGLEAVSRGAVSVRFVEADARAARRLEANIQALGLEAVSELVRADALVSGSWGAARPRAGVVGAPSSEAAPEHGFDVVFFDPPYPLLRESTSRRELLLALERLVRGALAPEGVVVFHAPAGELRTSELAPGIAAAQRRYGSNALWYLQHEPAEDEA